jgi:small subunit ribosomal protein S6
MNKYEAVVIFDPNSSIEEMDAVLTKIKDVISADGEIKEVFEWGKKRFAYPIFKKTEGFYYLITFDAKTDVPLELKRIARITDLIFRFRVFLRDDSVTAMPQPRRSYNRNTDHRTPRSSDDSRDQVKASSVEETPTKETTETNEDIAVVNTEEQNVSTENTSTETSELEETKEG